MSLDSSDLVDSVLTEQSRLNASFADGDIDQLVVDYQNVSGEKIGLTEAITPVSVGTTPHKWDDAQTLWNYAQWPS
jgi:hypothetical protein